MDIPEFSEPPAAAGKLKEALAMEEAATKEEPKVEEAPKPKVEKSSEGYTDIEIPAEIKSKKAADHFRAATTAKRKAEEKAEELSKMLDERQSKYDQELQDLRDQLSGLSGERDKLQDTLKSIDIERDPQFQQAYQQQESQVNAALQSAVGLEAAEKFMQLGRMPAGPDKDSQLAELTEGMNQVQASRVGAALAKLDELTIQRSMEIENSRQNWEQLQAKRQEELTKQQEAANNVFKGTLSNASKVLEVFSNEDDAKAVSEAATAIFSGSNDVEDVARAAVWAAAAPKYRSLYGQAQQQIADLQKELAELKGAEPGLAGSPAGDGGDGAPKDAVAAFAAALRG